MFTPTVQSLIKGVRTRNYRPSLLGHKSMRGKKSETYVHKINKILEWEQKKRRWKGLLSKSPGILKINLELCSLPGLAAFS